MKRRGFLKSTLAAFSLVASGASLGLHWAVAGVWSKVKPDRRCILPPRPKWNRVTDDIDSADFARRSRNYERSLLPGELMLPRTGEIWEAVRECEVSFLAWFGGPSWARPATLPCGRAKLPRGERVRIQPTDDPKPLTISFTPLRYEELLESLVPEHIRKAPGFSQYTLTLRTARTPCCFEREPEYFTNAFKLILASLP